MRRSRAVLFGVSACALALAVAACSGEASHSPTSAGRLNFFQFNNADSLANYVNTWYAVSLWKVLTGSPNPSADIPAAARQQALNTVLGYARRVALPCRGAKLSVIAGTPTMVEFWTARCKIRTLPKGSVAPGAPTIEASLPPGLVAARRRGASCRMHTTDRSPHSSPTSPATESTAWSRSHQPIRPNPGPGTSAPACVDRRDSLP